VHRALTAAPLLDRDALDLELRHRLVAHPLLERRLDLGQDRAVDGVQRRLRLLHGHVGLQAREEVGPVAAPVLEAVEARGHEPAHRDRHEDVRAGPERCPAEVRRRHADDGHRLAVDNDRLAEHAGIGAEVRLPVAVAQHGKKVPAHRPVVLGREQASQRRPEAEHREVRAGDEHPLAVQRLPAVGEVRAEGAVGGDTREHGLRALQVPKHRVAEHQLAVPCLVARLRAGLRARRAEVDEAPRLVRRQGAEQHLVEQREDRRVRPDPEGEREHRDGRHERRLAKRANGERQVAHGGPRGGPGIGGWCRPAVDRGGARAGCHRLYRLRQHPAPRGLDPPGRTPSPVRGSSLAGFEQRARRSGPGAPRRRSADATPGMPPRGRGARAHGAAARR
jgi:hypothetical protein